GKDGYVTGQLRRFARGILYVARQWRVYSPFAGASRSHVRVLSAAGVCGARGGFVDVAKAEAAIRSALAEVDVAHEIATVDVDLRQDSVPGVFSDRFVAGAGRCWCIGHGIDDLGTLDTPGARSRPTTIAQDCQTYRDI